MHQVELRGSYEQMGRQQAQRLMGWTPPPPEPKMLRFAKQCEEMMDQYAPELLDEMRGMAEASGVDYDTLMTLTVTAPFELQDVASCTVLAVTPELSAAVVRDQGVVTRAASGEFLANLQAAGLP